MDLDKIHEEWAKDSHIDPDDLGNESIRTSSLHSKYFKLLSKERLLWKKLKQDYKNLRVEKEEFLISGHTAETKAMNWELPARGRIMKSEVGNYLDVDKQLAELGLKVEYQSEKVATLEAILYSLNNRSYSIRNAIEWRKLITGG